MDFNIKFNEYKEYFEKRLTEYFDNLSGKYPKPIYEAMYYAVKDGGKRIRPVLSLSSAEMLGLEKEQVINLALAIEFIHSYSLVHDDLPSMDNDDYRRGKLSTHKKFGEAIGILAGDGLLNLAIETALSYENYTENYFNAVKEIFSLSGASGMIAGQVLDLESEKGNIVFDEKSLYDIEIRKTSCLISAPLLSSSVLSGRKYYEELKAFGLNLGLLFQITDDILDETGKIETIGKTPHKDINKLTSVTLFGLSGAREKADFYYNNCLNALSEIENSEFLRELLNSVYKREK